MRALPVVSENASKREPAVLARAHTRPDRSRGFFRGFVPQIAVPHRRSLHMQIDPVEQRTGDALAIALDLDRAAATFPPRVAQVSTRTRVHRGDQHEFSRKRQSACGARDRHLSVFNWLSHYLESGAFEFRKLVQKQHAVVARLISPGPETRHRLSRPISLIV